MTKKVDQKERLILQVIEKLPFADEDKKAWEEIIQGNGANEELLKDILEKSSQFTAEGEGESITLKRNTIELARLIHAWRLEQNLGNLTGGKRKHH